MPHATRPHSAPSAATAAFLVAFAIAPAQAQPAVPMAASLRLAAAHAPGVNAHTLLSFAHTESGRRPFAIHDNTTGASTFPATAAEATALASQLLGRGHSLDLGFMQVNSANLVRTGLTVASAFDTGSNIRAGATILAEAYGRCLHGDARPTPDAEQAALRCAASIYNTGRERAGIANGYQARVWATAARLVPAIRVAGVEPAPAAPDDVRTPEPRRPARGLADPLHASPPTQESEGLSDALHPTPKTEDTP